MVQGRKLRSVKVVTRVVGKVDKEKRASLEKMVMAVHSLLVASRLKWKVRAVPYTVHGGDEVLWTVSGVSSSKEDQKVVGEVRYVADMAWGVGTVNVCWVEEKESVYVIVRGIPVLKTVEPIVRLYALYQFRLPCSLLPFFPLW